MKSWVIKNIFLLGLCSICGCDSAVDSNKESSESPPVVVIGTIRSDTEAATQKSVYESAVAEIDPAVVGTGPGKEGYEYVRAEDGSAKIDGYLWHDGYASDDCTGDVVVEFRIKDGSKKTSRELFEQYVQMNSFIPRGRQYHCVNTPGQSTR